MATIAPQMSISRSGDRFFANLALAMCIVTVAGFVTNLAFGRSSFQSPIMTHVHALAFMSWICLFIVQSRLGVGESRALHRTLGWIGAGWAAMLVVVGCSIIVSVMRRGATPFFFQPQHLMFGDPFSLFGFAILTYFAVRMRRRTDWHSRLHIGAMTMLVPPGVGRLLPLPLLQPWAFEIASLIALLFPLAGAIRDHRKSGRVHPAWAAIFIAMPISLIAARVVAFSPVGDAVYRAVTAGSPGAAIPGRSFGTPPSSLSALRVVPRPSN